MCRITSRSWDVHISTIGYTLGRHLFGLFQLGTNSSLTPALPKFTKEKKEPRKRFLSGMLAHWLTRVAANGALSMPTTKNFYAYICS